MPANNRTFVKITNNDIFHELQQIKEAQQEQIRHAVATNGRVKRSLWIASTALSLAIIVIGLLFQHMKG